MAAFWAAFTPPATMRGMPQFSTKRLFIAVAITAIGFGLLAYGCRYRNSWEPLACILSAAFIGAAIGCLYKRVFLGARLGLVIGMGLFLLTDILVALITHHPL